MKFKYLFALLSIFLSPNCNAALLPVSGEVQIEPVTSFTTLELWRATDPTSVDLGDITVNYRMVDSEAPISRKKWNQCGMVMVGSGDIGMRPVAFRIWTKQACNLSMKKSEKLASSGNGELYFIVNPNVLLRIQVSRELVVTVGKKRIGQIRSGLD